MILPTHRVPGRMGVHLRKDHLGDALLDKRNASYRWHPIRYICGTLTEPWRGPGDYR